MSKNGILASAIALSAAVLCLSGAARAQEETVIVPGSQDRLEMHQLLGRVDGEVNPQMFSISRTINLPPGLDLRRGGDLREARAAIRDTAAELCGEIDAYLVGKGSRTDPDENRACIRDATREAMQRSGIG